MRRWFAVGLFAAGLLLACSGTDEQGAVHVITADGTVGPVMEQYLDRALDDAEDTQAKAAVIALDTPGGLDSSMRAIVRRIQTSEVPVIVYVSPLGGRAASAGTFITMSGHVAAMAPNTSIGAASAINSDGSDIEGTLGTKIENDAVAFIRGIAELHGRNADWAEQAVREAVAVSQSEAVELNVVDFVATDIDDLLAQSEGRTVKLSSGEPVTLQGLTAASQVDVEMTLWEKILDFVADPAIASLLLSIGFLLILFEFAIPGIGVSGIAGATAIILGFLGFGVLPVDTAGLILMALGLALIVVEVFLANGLFGIAGAVILAIGAFVAFRDTPSEFRPPAWLAVGIVIVFAVAFVTMSILVRRMKRNNARTSGASFVGQFAVATTDLVPGGSVRIQGERWNAQLLGADHVPAGEKLRVVAADQSVLHVRKEEPTQA